MSTAEYSVPLQTGPVTLGCHTNGVAAGTRVHMRMDIRHGTYILALNKSERGALSDLHVLYHCLHDCLLVA